MSRNIQKNKNQYENYLTLNNNCKIVINSAKPTNQLNPLNPENILTQNQRQIWFANELPASCIIDMRNMIQKPLYFNRIGFNCWHEYESNPKLIQIEYSSQDNNVQNANWIVWSKLRLQLISGWQHFRLSSTQSKNINFLKITMVKNHCEMNNEEGLQDIQKTVELNGYLNQVSLGYLQQTIESRVQPSGITNQNPRQKTFSDYRKLTTSQKQIKKLNQKVKHLTSQNQVMKRTVDHQSTMIIKLQEIVDSLAQHVTKLQKRQSIQQNKIDQLQEHNKRKHKIDPFHKQRISDQFNEQQYDLRTIESKKHSRQRQRQRERNGSRHNSVYDDGQHQSQFSRHVSSKNNSIYKSGKGKSHQMSQQSKKRQRVKSNIRQVQDMVSYGEEMRKQGTRQRRKMGDQHLKQILQQNQRNLRKQNPQQIRQIRGSHPRDIHRGEHNQKIEKNAACIPMIQKLQRLIQLRDQKQHRLKGQNKSRNIPRIVLSSQDDSQSDQY